MSKLKVLSFSITNVCNLTCRFCSRETNDSNKEFLRCADIIDTVKETLRFTTPRTIAISGGEPLCHPDIFNILESLNTLGTIPLMNTNGTLISPENAQNLKNCGVEKVSISIDALDKKTNIEIGRGNIDSNTYQEIFYNLSNVGISYFVKMTINTINIQQVLNVKQFAKENGSAGFGVSKTLPVGRGLQQLSDYYLPWKEYQKICHKCSQSRDDSFSINIDDPMKVFLDLDLTSLIANYGTIGETAGCTAGRSILYVMPNGDFVPCPALPLSQGNIKTDSIYKVWHDSDTLHKLRDRSNLKGKCHDCIFTESCGGCRGAAYNLNLDPFSEDPSCPFINPSSPGAFL